MTYDTYDIQITAKRKNQGYTNSKCKTVQLKYILMFNYII